MDTYDKSNMTQTTQKNLIERADDALLKFNRRLAMKWMDRTHKSKSDLEKRLYYGSGALFGVNAVASDDYIMMAPAALSIVNGAFESLRMTGPDYNKQKESNGIEKLLLYGNVIIYGLGVIQTMIGAGCLVAGIMTQDHNMYKRSFDDITCGVGAIGWTSANYISRAEIPEQTKKQGENF